MKKMLTQLKELTELTGPSGFEEDIVEYTTSKLQDLGVNYHIDALGNVISTIGDKGPTLMLSVHADEIGFIVSKIEDNGFVKFERIGGGDQRILLAQRVWLQGSQKRLLGVIGCKSAHLASKTERGNVIPFEKLYIDVGADSADEVIKAGVNVGTPISFASEFMALGCGNGKRLIGKALDDRLGCVILLRLLRELKEQDLPCKVVSIFSTQEEVGLRGAKVASYTIDADVALAIDATACGDTPDGEGKSLKLGAGVGIKVMDFSMIAHRTVKDSLVQIAQQNNIPYQLELLTGIGTDAGALHLQKAGTPSGVISIPNRYTHSPVEMVDTDDLEHSYQLLKAFVLSLTDAGIFKFGGGRL